MELYLLIGWLTSLLVLTCGAGIVVLWLLRNKESQQQQFLHYMAAQQAAIADERANSREERRELEDRLMAISDAIQNWVTLPSVTAVRPEMPASEITYEGEEKEGRFSGAKEA